MSLLAFEDAAIEVATFPKGKVLFRQGERGGAAYVVNSGAVGIYRETGERKIPLATVRKGELFGEMAVIDNSARMATAFTLEESTLMVIPTDVMMDKMRKSDPFIKALVHMLMNNLRSVHDSYTPKSRSLLDSVTSLHRQSELVARFMLSKVAPDVRAELDGKLIALDETVKELRRIAMTHRGDDRRNDAIPNEADLPQS
jgi:CRP/FNR family cyclic AMP-dependent transcriptional regulator